MFWYQVQRTKLYDFGIYSICNHKSTFLAAWKSTTLKVMHWHKLQSMKTAQEWLLRTRPADWNFGTFLKSNGDTIETISSQKWERFGSFKHTKRSSTLWLLLRRTKKKVTVLCFLAVTTATFYYTDCSMGRKLANLVSRLGISKTWVALDVSLLMWESGSRCVKKFGKLLLLRK